MTTPAVAHQPKQAEVLPKKHVSAKALTRLGHAKAAIAVTKKVLKYGAGNQIEAIEASRMNSNFRLQAMRNSSYWSLAPELMALARANPEALTAAKADLVHGGNCGEHAYIAYDYLRAHAGGEHIAYAASEIDHAFVLLGDRDKETPADMAVADPWPTNATACLWEDHFCVNTKVDLRMSMEADGMSLKGAIAAGLRLSAAGKAASKQKMTRKQTDENVADYQANHFWNQPDTVDEGNKFDYVK